MDFKETLFKRTLVKALRDGADEEQWKMAEELTVTKEANGYALWYQGRDIILPRIIGWSIYGKDDVISYAARIDVGTSRRHAQDHFVLYDVPKLFDLAQEPEQEAQKLWP